MVKNSRSRNGVWDMKVIDQFKNKKVLVLGLAKSQWVCGPFVGQAGCHCDSKWRQAFWRKSCCSKLARRGIKVVTGGHPLELLDEDFALMVKKIQVSRIAIPWLKRHWQRDSSLDWGGIGLLDFGSVNYRYHWFKWKTTTTTMTGEVLTAAGQRGLLSGNIGYPASQVAQNCDSQGHTCHGTFFFPTNGCPRIPSWDCGYYQPHANSYRLSWFFWRVCGS